MNQHTFFSGSGLIAATLATGCCALPFLLFSLGVSGAWIGRLRVLEPYSSYFLVVALLFVGLGFYFGAKKKQAIRCSEGGYCTTTIADRVRQALLWLSLSLIVLAALWPFIVQHFFGSST